MGWKITILNDIDVSEQGGGREGKGREKEEEAETAAKGVYLVQPAPLGTSTIVSLCCLRPPGKRRGRIKYRGVEMMIEILGNFREEGRELTELRSIDGGGREGLVWEPTGVVCLESAG